MLPGVLHVAAASGPIPAVLTFTLLAGPRTTIWNASNSFRADWIEIDVAVGTLVSPALILCMASVTVTLTANACAGTSNAPAAHAPATDVANAFIPARDVIGSPPGER